ncbi:MAG: DUF481 domain-containing protein [Myxococcota bacterium]
MKRPSWLVQAALWLPIALLAQPTASTGQGETAPEETAPAEAVEPESRWSGELVIGASLASGDVDVFTGHLKAGAERKWTADTLRLGWNGIYGITDGEQNANAQAATADWRHFFSERIFSYVDAEVGRDTIQQINWRFIGNTGPGWRAWEAGEKRHLDLELGIGYRHEEYRGVTPTRDDANVRFAFEHLNRVGEVLEVAHTGEFLLPVNDPEGFLARTELVLAVPLGASWHFRNGVALEYANEPAVGNEEVNIKASAGLEYRF